MTPDLERSRARARWSRVSLWAGMVAALAVAAAAVAGIAILDGRADETRRAQVLLSRLDRDVGQLEELGWRAVDLGEMPPPELLDRLSRNDARVEQTIAALHRVTPDRSSLVALVARHGKVRAAVGRVLEATAEGQAQSGRIQRYFVVPAAEQFRLSLARADAGYERDADRSNRRAVVGSALALIATLLAFLLLFWRFTRTRSARVEAEQRALSEHNGRLREQAAVVELLHAVAAGANAAATLEEALGTALSQVCGFTGWPLGHAYLPSDAGDGVLLPSNVWHGDSERFAAFVSRTAATPLAPGVGLPGRVAASGEAVWIADLEGDSTLPRAAAMREAGIRSGFSFPVRTDDSIVAVLEFFGTEPVGPSERHLQLMKTVCAQIAHAVERRRGERALRAAEAKYRALVEQLPLITYLDEANETCASIYISPQIEAVLGYRPQEWLDDPDFFPKVLHPDDRGWVLGEHERAYAEGRGLALEYRLVHRDGHTVWFRDEMRILRDANGHALYAQGYLLDITERKEQEQRLRETETRYRTLVEQLPFATYIDAPDGLGSTTYLSPQIEALVGYAPEEWIADHEVFRKVLHPEDRERVLAEIARAAAELAPVSQEYRMVTRDGRTIWIRDSAVTVRAEGDVPSYRQGFVVDVTERREAEERLRDSEERARLLFDTALDGLVMMSSEGVITGWNSQAETIFGWSREEAIGRVLGELIIPETYRNAHQRGLERFLETGDGPVLNRRIEINALRRGGAEFPIELAIVPIRRAGLIEFAGFIRDITSAREAEQRLRDAETKYRTLVEQLPLAVYAFGLDDRYEPIYRSPRIEAVLGYPVEDWLADPDFFPKHVHPEDRDRVMADVEHAQASGEPFFGEFRMITRDGSVVWVRDENVTIEDTDGRPAYRQGFIVDVTSAKEAEERLREAETKYRTLIEQLPLVTYVDVPPADGSSDWEGVYVSPQIETVLGYSPEAWMGRNFFDLVHPEDRPWVYAEHERVYTTFEEFDHEYRFIHRNGHTVWVRDQMIFIRDGDDAPLLAQGYLLDVTRLKASEAELAAQNEELRTLDRLKDEFIALVSHELRTPLTSIRGYLELVLDDASSLSDEQAGFLSVASRNAERLQNLVGDLLFIAQVEAGRLTLEHAPVDLARVAQESIEAARPHANGKGIELELRIEPVPALSGDRGRLGQLLDNFVSNGLKFTPNGGCVSVSVRHEDGHAVVEVADTGMGIPDDEQARLFERFFRTTQATEQAIQGTGLGLAISRAIAEGHGGRISFTSAEGEGTTFRIELPIAAALEEAA